MSTAHRFTLISGVIVSCSLVGGSALADKKRHHAYVGQHPISHKTSDGFCYIEAPHVHASSPPKKHKALYRDHRGHSQFVADPQPFQYDGDTHAYYGHHPVAVDVVVGVESRYEPGQQLEYCYLNGPHYHAFEPQPGLTFEVKGGVQWYIGDLPAAYVEAKPVYVPGNRVYATVEVAPPVVEIDAPPVGYVGPVLDVHVHGGHGHRGRGHGAHVDGHVGVGVHVEVPTIEVGIGLPGVVFVDDHHHGHRKHKKHKKHKKFKKHKSHKRFRRGRGR